MKKVIVMMVLALCGVAAFGQQDNLPPIEEINIPISRWWVNFASSKNMIFGLGEGKLSTISASCEQAKFFAQVSICRQIYERISAMHDASTELAQKDIIDELNLYRAKYQLLRSILSSERASFELSEFITVERRGKTADGVIWYLLSINKDNVKKIEKYIVDAYDIEFEEIDRL